MHVSNRRGFHRAWLGEGWRELLRGAISTALAEAVRASILRAIPPEKRSTRVFSNMGCQVTHGL